VARALGKVKVRQYAASTRTNSGERRTIIDFDEDETTMRFLLLEADGGRLRLGVELLELEWPELMKLARIIARTGRALSVNTEETSSPTVLG